MDKHKFYNEVLYELFDESYDLMAHDNFVKYVIAQRDTRWNIKKKLDLAKSYETKMQESNGHWVNVRKYPANETKLVSKDLKPAERSAEFLSGIIDKLNENIGNHSMKPYKANELLFFENIIENLSNTEAKLVTISGDVNQNIGYLKRRVLESDAINQDNVRSKRRVKEKIIQNR